MSNHEECKPSIEEISGATFKRVATGTAKAIGICVSTYAQIFTEEKNRKLARLAAERFIAWLDGRWEDVQRIEAEGHALIDSEEGNASLSETITKLLSNNGEAS